MKGIAIRALVPTLSAFFAALAFCLPQPSPVVADDQKVQVIGLTAKKYEYSPSPVHVKIGTKVQLRITAVDHDHGFKIGARSMAINRVVKMDWSLLRRKTAGSLKKERQRQLNFWRKSLARTRLGVATLAVLAIGE